MWWDTWQSGRSGGGGTKSGLNGLSAESLSFGPSLAKRSNVKGFIRETINYLKPFGIGLHNLKTILSVFYHEPYSKISLPGYCSDLRSLLGMFVY